MIRRRAQDACSPLIIRLGTSLHCRSNIHKSPDLASQLQGVTQIRPFMASDAVKEHSESYKQALLKFARSVGVTVLMRSGTEYKVEV